MGGPTGRSSVTPPQGAGAFGAGGGGGGAPSSPTPAGISSGAAFGRAPSSPTPAGISSGPSFASVTPPTPEELAADTCNALHELLDAYPAGTTGRLDGSAGVVGRFALIADKSALIPIEPIEFAASPDGAVWDSGAWGDYTWGGVVAGAGAPVPSFGALGLILTPNPGGGFPYALGRNNGLAGVAFDLFWVWMDLASDVTWPGPNGASVPPLIYCGLHRVAAGTSAGLVAAAARGVASASTFGRALVSVSPTAPTYNTGVGAVPEAALASSRIALTGVGRSANSNSSGLCGGWLQPAPDLSMLTLSTSIGGAGADAHPAILGMINGTGGAPPASITIARMFYGGRVP